MRKRIAIASLLMVGALFVAPVSAHAATEGETGTEISHEAHECIELLEKGESVDACNEAPSPIQPEVNEMIWGGLAFIILFGLMAKFAYPSIKKGMDARSEKIRIDIDSAEQAKLDAEQMLDQYKKQLADAKGEANRILEEARSAADSMRTDLMTKAETEATELRQRNAAEIETAKDRLLVDLRADVTGMAIELAEKVVEKNLDKDTNSKLIDEYIKQVAAHSTSSGRAGK